MLAIRRSRPFGRDIPLLHVDEDLTLNALYRLSIFCSCLTCRKHCTSITHRHKARKSISYGWQHRGYKQQVHTNGYSLARLPPTLLPSMHRNHDPPGDAPPPSPPLYPATSSPKATR